MVADGNRRGYKHLLDAFWDEALGFGLKLPTSEPVSAPSFCTARYKITADLLRRMLHELAASFDGAFASSQRWLGRRVFAVDGTKINLQRSDELKREFGVPDGAYCPQVLVSILLDVCAKAPVDVVISPFASSEREHLFDMLPSLARGDVLVLDRGYPSHEVLQRLSMDGIDFLVRVPSSHTFKVIDELRESDGDDCIVRVDPPEGAPMQWTPLTLRAIRLKTPDGAESFFLTSLQKQQSTQNQLRELYHMRWQVEEFFKVMKSDYIGQGQFRSKLPAGVEQEIHALVLFLAITRVLMMTAAKAAGAEYRSLSQKAAVLGLASYVTRLLLEADRETAIQHLHDLLRRIIRTRERPRPGRSAPAGRSWRPAPRRLTK